MQDLHTLGLNPFAVTLLAESMLKSAYVKRLGTEPLTFDFPVQRSDCAGWLGVRITIEAVPVPAEAADPSHDCCPQCGNDDNETEEGSRHCLACGHSWKSP